MDLHFKELMEGGAVIVNAVVLYIMLKVRVDISELKIWVMENFERRKNAR